MSSNSISIVVTTYNRGHTLPVSLLSAMCQIHRNDEIIVVDDGSLDQTEELIKPLLTHKCLKYYRHQKNQGVQYARNTGIKKSTKNWISFLDSDDHYLPGGIEKIKISINKYHQKFDILQFMLFTYHTRTWGNQLGFLPSKPWKQYVPTLSDVVLKRKLVGDMHRVIKTAVAKKNLWDTDNPGHETYYYSQLASRGYHSIYLNQQVVAVGETDANSHSHTRHARWPQMHLQLYAKFLDQYQELFNAYPIRKAGYYRCIADCYRNLGNMSSYWFWMYRSFITYPIFFNKTLP